MSFEQSLQTVNLLRDRMKHDVMGRDDVIDLVIIALLASGPTRRLPRKRKNDSRKSSRQ